MEISSHFALDAIGRTIGDFPYCIPIQSYSDRKTTGRVISDNLDASDGLTSRPLPNSIEAFLA
jgi:hypothetical protein